MDTYLELLKAKKTANFNSIHELDILVLTNITVNPLKDYLEYQAGLEGIKANVTFGDYDNIVQNAKDYDLENKVVIVFWELANLLHGLEYKIDTFDKSQIDQLEEKVKTELKFTFEALNKASLVIMNSFSALAFTHLLTETSALEQLADRLNDFCRSEAPAGIKWVNIDKCLVNGGIKNSIDYKGYLKSKWLYKHDFFDHYSKLIQPYLNALCGKLNKLLALDCDNTLWHGIIGEDGSDGIAMDENTFKGQAYAAAQYRAIALGRIGVLLALVSKNNPEDVDAVIESHNDITIADEDLVAKKVNWMPKGENLDQLAKELNIGLDSFVFVDDSDFEIQMMRDQYPTVTSIQASNNSVSYYIGQMAWPNYFVQLNKSDEDAKKLVQYKQNARRANEAQKHEDFESFLADLGIQLTIYQNKEETIPRMAQMTQKTNQFNLTTERYTESQIEKFVTGKQYDCFAFSTEDKFGDSGVTGLCIVDYVEEDEAVIDSLLMSCRVLGRNIEFRFMDEVLNKVFKRSKSIKASFIPTKKNAQVADFYGKIGMEKVEESQKITTYKLNKENFNASNPHHYIKLNYD